MMKKRFALLAMMVFFVDIVLATGVSASDDVSVEELIDKLQTIKTSLFDKLDGHVEQVSNKLESTYEDLEASSNYSNLVCMGVVDFDTDVDDVKDGADLLKSKILRTYNTIISDIQYNRDSFDNGLVSEQTYELSLESNVADVSDFQSNFSTFVTDFYNSEISSISGKFSYMDSYMVANKSLVDSLEGRRAFVDTIVDGYADLMERRANYLQHFGTVLGIDEIHDNLLESIQEDVEEYFSAKKKTYLEKHSNFFLLPSKLVEEEKILFDLVEVELRRYMDDMVRYYDGDQYEVLDEYMSTIKGLYYSEEDKLLCNNILGYWDEPMIETIIALIQDLESALDDGFEYFDIEDGVASSEDFFGEKLNEEYKRIVSMVVDLYDERTADLLDTMVTQWKEYRSNFKDLLRIKALEFDKASGSKRDSIKNDLIAKAKALATKVNGERLAYDVQFLMYVLGEPVFLGAYEYPGMVSMSNVDYLEFLYQDYLSDEGISSSLVLATGFVPRSAYSVEEVQAKLVLFREVASDKDEFDEKLVGAIQKANELLKSQSVSLTQKVLIKTVRDAMWKVLY